MAPTALYDKLAGMGVRLGEYRGAETALSFSNPRVELAALVRGCGVYDLGWRAHIRISGRDRVRWLNGMVSNNIRELPERRGNYNFLLNAQGRIHGDLYVYNRGDHFIAGTEAAQLENLLKLLRKYIIMDQVELTDLGPELTAIGVQGPEARAVLSTAGFAGSLPDPMELAEADWRAQKFSITRMANERFETYEIWLPPAAAPAVWDALVSAGATPVGTEALEMFRVAAGIPRFGLDLRERDLPQETAQMQALNFDKGCYIGQEIVERIRSRGNVHRTLAGFIIEGSRPEPGSKIQVDGKDVGEITSSLELPALEGESRPGVTLALGYVRRENAQPGALVQVAEATAKVSALPFADVF
jgi:folate-binding protein YgfZ